MHHTKQVANLPSAPHCSTGPQERGVGVCGAGESDFAEGEATAMQAGELSRPKPFLCTTVVS